MIYEGKLLVYGNGGFILSIIRSKKKPFKDFKKFKYLFIKLDSDRVILMYKKSYII
jgi:hypothetical protein